MDKDPVAVCEADVAAAFAEAASQRSSVSPISSSGRFAVHNTALSLQSLPPLTPPQLRSALSHALADTPTYTSAASTSSSLQCRLPPLPSGRMLASGALASPLCSTAKTYLFPHTPLPFLTVPEFWTFKRVSIAPLSACAHSPASCGSLPHRHKQRRHRHIVQGHEAETEHS